jgi:hypothetical protein
MRVLPLLLCLVLASSLAGCAKPRIESRFPDPLDSDASARVVVLRNRNLVNSYVSAELVLNEWAIARLWTRQFLSFEVPPGRHSIGVIVGTEWIDAQPGQTYYFLISPTCLTNLVARPIEADDARERMEKYVDVSPGTDFWKELEEKERAKQEKKAQKEAKKEATEAKAAWD